MRLMTVVGARPQFIKAAALSRAIVDVARRGVAVDDVIVHTGQHYDTSMSAVFFEGLGIPRPDVMLNVGSATHGVQTGEIMLRLEPYVMEHRPDALVVYGDTNSTLAAALVASKLLIPLVHIEAGLRSFDRTMPEEVNRVVADHLSDLLLCPSQHAIDNLEREGIRKGVHVVGDVMLDVLRHELSQLPSTNALFDRLAIGRSPVVLVTLHRPSNVDNGARLHELVTAIEKLANDGYTIVWPVHPRLGDRIHLTGLNNVFLVEPLNYAEMVCALRDAVAVVTDSGGLQKEAFWMERPCFTLRDETEWVETVECGWNMLLGTRPYDLATEVAATLQAPRPPHPQPYGDATAARQALGLIMDQGW